MLSTLNTRGNHTFFQNRRMTPNEHCEIILQNHVIQCIYHQRRMTSYGEDTDLHTQCIRLRIPMLCNRRRS